MRTIINKITDFFKGGKYTPNNRAAEIIRRFVTGVSDNPYEWDDFESVKEKNPEAGIALLLCWFIARKYPSSSPTEYCAKEADKYFLRIADALENGQFRNLNQNDIQQTLDVDMMPPYLTDIIGVSPNDPSPKN